MCIIERPTQEGITITLLRNININCSINVVLIFVLCLLNVHILFLHCGRSELSLAYTQKKPIIPLKLDAMDWPPENLCIILTDLLFLDFSKPNNDVQNDWNCSQFGELLKSINEHLHHQEPLPVPQPVVAPVRRRIRISLLYKVYFICYIHICMSFRQVFWCDIIKNFCTTSDNSNLNLDKYRVEHIRMYVY